MAKACLDLQDHCGVDVNVLLIAAYYAVELKQALTRNDLEALDASICSWRSEVIQPLRSVRRWMKSSRQGALDEAQEVLRQQVKTCELRAEQIEQAFLARQLRGLGKSADANPPDLRHVLAMVVDFYRTNSDADDGNQTRPQLEQALIDTIAQAATAYPRRISGKAS